MTTSAERLDQSGPVSADRLCKRWGLGLHPRGECLCTETHGQHRLRR